MLKSIDTFCFCEWLFEYTNETGMEHVMRMCEDSPTTTHWCTPTRLGLDVGPPMLEEGLNDRERHAQDFLHGCQEHEEVCHLALEVLLQEQD